MCAAEFERRVAEATVGQFSSRVGAGGYRRPTAGAIIRWLLSIRSPFSKERVLAAAPVEFKATDAVEIAYVRLLTNVLLEGACVLCGEVAGRALMRVGGELEVVQRFTGFEP
jgi:hypothetical protein